MYSFGTGTGEILRLCKQAGLNEPVFNLHEGFKITIWRPNATDVSVKINTIYQVTDQVNEVIKRLIVISDEAYSRQQLMDILQLKHNPNFRDNYLNPAIEQGYLEMTLPEKPNSNKQKYRLTTKGQVIKNKLEQGE